MKDPIIGVTFYFFTSLAVYKLTLQAPIDWLGLFLLATFNVGNRFDSDVKRLRLWDTFG